MRIIILLLVFSPLFSDCQIFNKIFYEESEISIPINDGGFLIGTITTPAAKDSNNVLGIIVPGSGPTDRDGNQYGKFYPNSYKFLAHDLAQKGISTFRYDKRGIAASYQPSFSESKITFDTYIDDLVYLIKYFQKKYSYRKIVLIGHSEGALISYVAGKRAEVNAIVSIAGPGFPMDSIILEQLGERAPFLKDKAADIFRRIRSNERTDSIPKELSVIFRPSIMPFLKSMLQYDPCTEINNINVPIAIIQGDNDLQIKVDDAKKLYSCKTTATLIIIPGMNHVFKLGESNTLKNIQQYNSPTIPIAHALINGIINFFNKNDLIGSVL
jgi:uncharacterized protein